MVKSSKNYQNGKIYCVRNNIDDDVYVGSTTTTLCKRMAKHRESTKSKEKKDRKVYAKMNEIGAEQFYIELIENYPCETLEQLRQREGYYIREMGTLNTQVAGRTKQGWANDHKEHRKQQHQDYYKQHKEKYNQQSKLWREEHVEEMQEYKKKWYEANKEELTTKQKERYENKKEEIQQKQAEYRDKNKDKLNEYFKQYREKNKDVLEAKAAVKMTCVCGGCFRKGDKARHEKTIMHRNFLEQQ